MTKILLPLAALCALLLAGTPAQAQSAAPAPMAAMATPSDDALFRALGAKAGIDAIVGDFVPRLVADPRTAEFFKKTNQAHLKEMLALQFCVVSGGGCTYTGLPMTTAHKDMDISKGDFNALVEVLQSSMDAQHVPFSTQNQLLARLAPMHRDIVTVH
ncbi:MAG: group 1 truncated hemoglobin [Burkholderiaceae bacterium]